MLQKEIEPERQTVHPYRQKQIDLEKQWLKIHLAEVQKQPPVVPLNIKILTLPSQLRKFAGGFESTKGRFAKQKMKLRRLTGKKSVVTLKPFNGCVPKPLLKHKDEHKTFWGFPEWYGPGEYGKLETLKRSLPALQERKLEAAELARMQIEESKQRDVDFKLLVKRKEEDLSMFATGMYTNCSDTFWLVL